MDHRARVLALARRAVKTGIKKPQWQKCHCQVARHRVLYPRRPSLRSGYARNLLALIQAWGSLSAASRFVSPRGPLAEASPGRHRRWSPTPVSGSRYYPERNANYTNGREKHDEGTKRQRRGRNQRQPAGLTTPAFSQPKRLDSLARARPSALSPPRAGTARGGGPPFGREGRSRNHQSEKYLNDFNALAITARPRRDHLSGNKLSRGCQEDSPRRAVRPSLELPKRQDGTTRPAASCPRTLPALARSRARASRRGRHGAC